MNAVLLHFLPVPNPQQLVYFHLKNQPLSTSQTGYGDMSMSVPIFEAMRNRQEVFSDVIGFAPLAFEKVAVRIGPEPEETWGEMVSGNFFSGLQVQPIMGRGFTLNDESTHAPIAVVNYAWWKGRLAGDKDILCRTIYIKGVPFMIVGVAVPNEHGGAGAGHRERKRGDAAAGTERQQAPGILPAPSAWGQQARPFPANAAGKRGPGSGRRDTWLAVCRGSDASARSMVGH